MLEEDEDSVLLDVAAGQNWHQLVEQVVDAGWSGLENMALIPGTVGAAPVQTSGAYGVELKDRFVSLTAYDREKQVFVEFPRLSVVSGTAIVSSNPLRRGAISLLGCGCA